MRARRKTKNKMPKPAAKKAAKNPAAKKKPAAKVSPRTPFTPAQIGFATQLSNLARDARARADTKPHGRGPPPRPPHGAHEIARRADPSRLPSPDFRPLQK